MSVITDIPAGYAAVEQVVEIPVGDIRPAPDNPRGDLGDLTDLANSIKSVGVVQAIVVTPRPEDGQPPYLCVIGHRRHAASIKAEKPTVRAIIRDMDEATRLILMHVENVQREDLKPTEEARSLKALADLGLSQRQIVERVGKSQAYISKRLSLLGLPDEVKAELDAGRLTVGDAIELARIKDDKQIRAIFKAARKNDDGRVTYDGITGRVGKTLADAARAKKVAQVERALRAEGLTVVPFADTLSFRGTAQRLGTGHNELDIEPDKHAKQKCHAAAVTRDAEVVYVCTEPDRHKPKEPTEPKPGKPAAAERVADNGGTVEDIAAERERAEAEAWDEYHQRQHEQEQAELAAATERRRAFIGDLLRGKPNKNEVLTLVLSDYLGMYEGWSDRVLVWLGIDVPEGSDGYAAFLDYAGASLANLQRAALALLLDEAESRMPDEAGTVVFLDRDVLRLYAFLTGNGYEPSDIEKRGLGQRDNATDDGDAEPGEAEPSEPGEVGPGESEPTGPGESEPSGPGESEPGEAEPVAAEADASEAVA